MHLETSVKVPLVLNHVTILLRSESFLSEIPQPLWTWIFCTANRKRWHVKQNTNSFFILETDNSSTASEASYVNVPPQHEEEDHSAASSENDYDEPETWWNQHHNWAGKTFKNTIDSFNSIRFILRTMMCILFFLTYDSQQHVPENQGM